MKHLEETPWYICDDGDINFCAYVDTDSNYFNAEPLLRYLYPDFETLEDSKKDELLENIALKYQNIITEHYNVLAAECFNVPNKIGEANHIHRLEMKTECVIRSAYFRATRRYAQWITKKEGVAKEELEIKGLEFMKANFPPIFGIFFNDILQQVLKGVQHKEILAIYADRQQVFDSILLNKLEGFFSDLGWSLDLNPHLNSLSSFEI